MERTHFSLKSLIFASRPSSHVQNARSQFFHFIMALRKNSCHCCSVWSMDVSMVLPSNCCYHTVTPRTPKLVIQKHSKIYALLLSLCSDLVTTPTPSFAVVNLNFLQCVSKRHLDCFFHCLLLNLCDSMSNYNGHNMDLWLTN